jgi:broad specificity phosphatase PhoE
MASSEDAVVLEQKWPDLLMIVRHGESERNVAKELAKANAHGTFGTGLRDVDVRLTHEGHRQAAETGKYLSQHYAFDVAFASPYKRTCQTMEGILAAYEPKPPILIEERLREIEFGILDGLTTEGIQTQYPNEFLRRQKEGKYWYRPPGGESRPDVALRIHSFLGTLTREYQKKNVLVVSHSVVVLIFRRLLERWLEEEYLQVDREADVLNCSLTAYRFDGERRKLLLECYNETNYSPSSARHP